MAVSLTHALRRVLDDEHLTRQSDRELLDRYCANQDEAAFAALLKRHEALVFGVCRRVLRDHALAEDAFQAVFVILARRAKSIRRRDALPSWLFGVARRIAQQALKRARRDRALLQASAAARQEPSRHDRRWEETLGLLEEELGRLPRCYQAPILACYLEGRTQDEAARALGWPLGTLRRRLDKGREILKVRLTRQGIAWSAGLFTLGLASGVAESAVLHELRQRALQTVLSSLQGNALSQGVVIMVQGSGGVGLTWRALVAGAALCTALAWLGSVWSAAQPAPPGEKGQLAPKIADLPKQASGDALPTGAVARLGTLRFNHGDGLTSVHYTPDGKTIVSVGGGFIRLWNADTGAELRSFATTKESFDQHTALMADGKTLVILSQQLGDMARFWDLEKGKQVSTVDLKERRGIISVYIRNALSTDGRLAALHTQQVVRVVETATGKERFRTNKRGEDVRAVAFTGDSKMLIQSGKDGILEMWDAHTGQPLKIFDQNPPAQVLAASPDGRWLATLEHHTHAIDRHLDKDVIHLWDLTQPKKVHAFAAKGWFMGIRFTPDSARLVANISTPSGYESHGWEVASGRPIANILPELGRARAFHPDGKRFVEGGGQFHQWDASTGKRLSSEDSTYAHARAVCFDDTGKRIHTLGQFSLTTWDAHTGKRLRSLELARYPYWDPRPIFSPDGRFALSYKHGTKEYGIEMLLWDVERGTSTTISLGDPPQKEYVNAQHHIAPQFTSDGSKLIVREPGPGKTALLRIWDVDTGREIKQLPENKGGWSLRTSLLADGKTLIVPGAQASGIDVTTGQELFAWKAPVRLRSKVFKEVKGAVGGPKLDPDAGPAWQSFAISPDGKTAAYIVGADFGNERVPDRIVLCDGRTGKLLHRLDDSGRRTRDLAQLVFSPDGRRLATSDGHVAHLWEVAAGTKLRTLAGHRGDIQALAFSRDGHRLATASADSTVLIWELR